MEFIEFFATFVEVVFSIENDKFRGKIRFCFNLISFYLFSNAFLIISSEFEKLRRILLLNFPSAKTRSEKHKLFYCRIWITGLFQTEQFKWFNWHLEARFEIKKCPINSLSLYFSMVFSSNFKKERAIFSFNLKRFNKLAKFDDNTIS